MLLSILLIILGLRLLMFGRDIRRTRPIPCPDMTIKRLDKVTEILDRQVEILEGLEVEIREYVEGAVSVLAKVR